MNTPPGITGTVNVCAKGSNPINPISLQMSSILISGISKSKSKGIGRVVTGGAVVTGARVVGGGGSDGVVIGGVCVVVGATVVVGGTGGAGVVVVGALVTVGVVGVGGGGGATVGLGVGGGVTGTGIITGFSTITGGTGGGRVYLILYYNLCLYL